jgi:creatinine amidohydrolase
MKIALSVPILVGLVVQLNSCSSVRSSAGGDRVLKLEEMTWKDIDQLDRAKTVFCLVFGIMEEHGPQLPIGNDWYEDLHLRDAVVGSLRVSHPDYTFVLVPPVPLGVGGANDLVGQLEHPGSLTIRFETLRNVVADLGGSISRKGFTNILVFSTHSMALHTLAVDQAADFITQRYHVRMIDVGGLSDEYTVANGAPRKMSDDEWPKNCDQADAKRFGASSVGQEGHAGCNETSELLYIQPGLVRPAYRNLPPFMVQKAEDARQRQDWQGYWGAPSVASAEFGKQNWDFWITRSVALSELALGGEDFSKVPHGPETGDLKNDTIRREQATYAAQTNEFEEWLKNRELAGK